MKKLLNVLCIALTLIFTLSLFAGCTPSNTAEPTPSPTEEASAPTATPTAKPGVTPTPAPDFSGINEPFRSILEDKQTFYSAFDKKDVKISSFYRDLWAYAYVDIDSDGTDEFAVMLQDGNVLILRKNNDKVIGFEFGLHGMYQINKDGTFCWNANSGNTYGISKLEFSQDGLSYTEVQLIRIEHDENDSNLITYYANGKAVSKDEYDLTYNKINTESIVWTYLTGADSVPSDFITSCDSQKFSSAQEAYQQKISEIRTCFPTILGYLEYFYKDIDGNGVEDLCITDGRECATTVYTFVDGQIKKFGREAFYTGTTRLFSSENKKYPGIFVFTCGGSADHYHYLSVKDGKLVSEDLWDLEYDETINKYSEDKVVAFTDDKEIIAESKYLYDNNLDIISKNVLISETFQSAEDAYQYQLNKLKEQHGNNIDKFKYFYKDFDGNGITELCVIDFNRSNDTQLLHVYSFYDEQILEFALIDFFSVSSITVDFFSSDKYTGLFAYTTNNSSNSCRCHYFTIVNNRIITELVFDKSISANKTESYKEHTDKADLIVEAKLLQGNGKAITPTDF